MRSDRETELVQLRTRIRECVEQSSALAARARTRARAQQDDALIRFTRAEGHLSHAARRLPAVYGLPWPSPDGTGDGILDLLLAAARSVYGDCPCVSVTAVDRIDSVGRRCYRTVATAGGAVDLDAAQYALGEGPTIEAVDLDHVTPVGADDVDADDVVAAWPRFRAVAASAGIHSVISVPVPWTRRLDVGRGRSAVGAINLYAPHTHAFDRPEAHGLMLGCWAGSVLSGKAPADVYDAVIWRPHAPPPA